jgi:hypothetical protein
MKYECFELVGLWFRIRIRILGMHIRIRQILRTRPDPDQDPQHLFSMLSGPNKFFFCYFPSKLRSDIFNKKLYLLFLNIIFIS